MTWNESQKFLCYHLRLPLAKIHVFVLYSLAIVLKEIELIKKNVLRMDTHKENGKSFFILKSKLWKENIFPGFVIANPISCGMHELWQNELSCLEHPREWGKIGKNMDLQMARPSKP